MSHHPTIPQYATWAHSALHREPSFDRDVRGISAEDASKRAQAICYVAGQSGQTLRALQWLKMLAPKIERGISDAAPRPRPAPIEAP